MYPSDTEILFPARVIPQLGRLRGETWHELVERVAHLQEGHPDSLALSLLMIRLDGCLTCQCDSYKAMRGCTYCALTTLTRYKGKDAELLSLYERAREDVSSFLASGG